MENCNPAKTPLPPGIKTYKATDANRCNEEQHQLYREIVGCILYLCAMTRPDLAYASSELSRYLSDPSTTHLILAKHVL
eukprot:3749464-Rhodomonas_salina.1